jgi:hypothetical protein
VPVGVTPWARQQTGQIWNYFFLGHYHPLNKVVCEQVDLPMENMIRINGIVIPIDWDPGGEVVAVAIATYDEGFYPVALNAKGPELIAHLRKTIQADGQIETRNGRQTIRVDRYTLLGGPPQTASPLDDLPRQKPNARRRNSR